MIAFFFAKRCYEKLIKSNGKYVPAIAFSINVSANKCNASIIYREKGGLYMDRRDVCIYVYIHTYIDIHRSI